SDTEFSTLEGYLSEYEAQSVFVSNGPGDPATADHTVEQVKKVLEADIPFFGICFGNQIFGRALGLDTYKLKFGHRDTNVPVKDLETDKVAINTTNNSFAIYQK